MSSGISVRSASRARRDPLAALAVVGLGRRTGLDWADAARRLDGDRLSRRWRLSAIADNGFYRAADDFVVPRADACWCISRIVVAGYTSNTPPPETIEVAIYDDAGTVPMDPPTTVATASAELGKQTLDVALTEPVAVMSGVHWLSVMPTIANIESSAFVWIHAEDETASPPVVKTDLVPPFMNVCLDWAPLDDCLSGALGDGDLAFELHGVAGGTGC